MTLAADLAGSLADLDLSRIVLSAALDAEGQLRPVGGMPAKLSAAAASALHDGSLEVIALAEGQEFPNAYRNLPHLLSVTSASLPDLVRKLHEQHGPRAAVRRWERERSARLDLPGREAVPLRLLYQELPLLRAVPAGELPSNSRQAASGDAAEEPFGLLRLADIQQWEEAQSQRQTSTYQCYSWRTVFEEFRRAAPRADSDVPRLALLAPPGGGKSTFAQFLAHETANGQLRRDSRIAYLPTRIRLRDWERWAVRRVNYSLTAYLCRLYRPPQASPAPTAEQWQRWLQRGEVLLLLDGLDEIHGDPTFLAEGLTPLLTSRAYSRNPLLLTCRTVSQELLERLGGEQVLPTFRLDGLDQQARDRFIESYPARHPQHFVPVRLIEQLNRLPAMRPLAANPLLLALICLVVDDPEGVPLPSTRGQLYDRAIEHLLGHYQERRRVKPRFPSEEPEREEKRHLLEEVALTLFSGSDRSLTFTWKEIKDVLRSALERAGYDRELPAWTQALATDFLNNSGLLRRDGRRKAFFLHLTIQEYLAACALARTGNRKDGWHQRLPALDGGPTLATLVNRKAWDIRWGEVLALLAGRLNDPAPLLALLREPRRDDFFRHRLARACACLPELTAEQRRRHQGLIDRITAEAFEFCWEYVSKDIFAVVEHLLDEMPHLEQAEGAARAGRSVGGTLQQLVQDGEPAEKLSASEMLGRLRQTAKPEYLAALLPLLGVEESDVRLLAVEAIRALAPAARPEHLDALIRLRLEDNADSQQVMKAAWALATAAQPRHIETLLPLLRHSDEGLRGRAVDMMRALKSAAKPEHAKAVFAILQDGGADLRSTAVEALGQLAAAARPEDGAALLSRLLLQDLAEVSDYSIMEALRALTPMVRPEHVPALLPLLVHADENMRKYGVSLLGQWSSAVRPEHLQTLLPAMLACVAEVHRKWHKWQSSVQLALKSMAAAARPAQIDDLLSLLETTEGRQYEVVVTALKLWAAQARPEHLDPLLCRLESPDRNQQMRAVEGLSALAAAAHPRHVQATLTLLRRADWSVRKACVAVLSALVPAARSEHVDEVISLLQDPDEDLQCVAAAALRELAGAARPEHADALAPLLHHADCDLRGVAASALGALLSRMPEVARPEYLDALPVLFQQADPEFLIIAGEVLLLLTSALPSAARPEHLDLLLPLLGHTDKTVQQLAVGGLGALSRTARPEHLDALLDCMRFHDGEVGPAIEGVKALATVAHPGHLDALIRLLSEDRLAFYQVGEVAKALAPAARTEHADALVPLLNDASREVQEGALEALSMLAAVARPEHVKLVLALLPDAGSALRCVALESLRSLAPKARPEIVEAVLLCLADADPDVRIRAAQLLAAQAAAARPECINALLPLLEVGGGDAHFVLRTHKTERGGEIRELDPSAAMREGVLTAGETALEAFTRPDHAEALLSLLQRTESMTRRRVARALRQMLSRGWRAVSAALYPLDDPPPRQQWTWRNVEQLRSLGDRC